MLLTGQPLHAFDLDKVAGGRLTIRRARAGESLETLDGQTRELDPEMVVIEDGDGPTSIAAIMGGARSEVGESTTRVLLEAANWNGANIQRSALRLGLRSEASARFEKGLSPGQTAEAMAVATKLLIELRRRQRPAGHDRCRWARTAARGDRASPAARQRAARERHRSEPLPRDPRGARIRRRRRRRAPAGHATSLPRPRRHPAGRPDRGGRTDRRPRPPARDASSAQRRNRSPHATPKA